jgi:hypothetical protein
METPLPTEHVDAEGWTVRTYADGNWSRRKILPEGGMICGQSWDMIRQETPQAVIDGDAAMTREAGRKWAEQRDKAFWKAFLGEQADEPIVVPR